MRPSPLHRDPDQDGDYYGCFTDAANAKVAKVVEYAISGIRHGLLKDDEAVVSFVRAQLKTIGEGSTDTIVKENVFYALDEALSEAGIHIEARLIYGW
jgi:hypothetical protein